MTKELGVTAIGRSPLGAPLGLEHGADDIAYPFALEELVLDELCLTAHPEALHDPEGRDISLVAAGQDPVEAQLNEPQAKYFLRAFRCQAASLDIRMEAPTNLALMALGTRQSEHELTD